VKYWAQMRRLPADSATIRYAAVLVLAVAAQYTLGILTLLWRVPIPLGVAHQAPALVIFGLWVAALHHARNLGPATA
jgi:cytochrome c oxidase assembly protein subunit 15